MTAFPSEYFLLLIILIITIISVLLCLYTAMLLSDVSKRITRLRERGGIQERGRQSGATERGQMPAAATFPEEIRIPDPLREHEDIAAGIGTMRGKYHIESLVIAMPDGLVVASAGSDDPEYDAAHYSSLFTGGYSMPDQGVWLLPVYHRGVSLVGIARSQNAIPEEMTSRIAEEITLLFARGL
jgi:hypothetical protein